MKQPHAFRKFAENVLHKNDTGRELQEEVDHAITLLSPGERLEFFSYLDQLLSGDYTDDELRDIWRYSPSNVIILEGIRGFLGAIRDMVQK